MRHLDINHRHAQSPVKHLRSKSPQKQCMALKTEGTSGKSPSSDALAGSEQALSTPHKNSPKLKTNTTSAKCSISDVKPSFEHTTGYNLCSDQILKVRQNIKFQVEAKSQLQKIITEVIIL